MKFPWLLVLSLCATQQFQFALTQTSWSPYLTRQQTSYAQRRNNSGSYNVKHYDDQNNRQTHVESTTWNNDEYHQPQEHVTKNQAHLPAKHICTIITEEFDCKIQNVHLRKDQPISFRRDNNIEKLAFIDSQFEYLPKSLIDAFPRLNQLNLDKLLISSIETNAFQNAAQLQKLYLKDNRLSAINEGAFNGADKLETILLSNNEITYLDSKVFDATFDLKILYLDQNLLDILPRFKNNQHLNYLNVSHNQLTAISEKHFQYIRNLQTLDVSFNSLKRLNLQHLTANMWFIDVSSNELIHLTMPPHVLDLNARNNSLQEVVAGQQCFLKRLNLERNSLTMVPQIQNCSSLVLFQLSYNLLEEFKFDTWMNNLQILNLTHNNIFEINMLNASLESSLKVLDLSHNKLTYFANLKILKKLEYLLLNNNKIITLKEYPDQSMANIQLFSIANNEWSCSEIPKFQRFITDNNMNDCPEGMQLRSGICCRAYGKPYNEILNQILRDADYHERQNKKNCQPSVPSTIDPMGELNEIRGAISVANNERANLLKKIEDRRTTLYNWEAQLQNKRAEQTRLMESRSNVAREIERQRKYYHVPLEALISNKQMLERIINHVRERDEFRRDLLSRRQQDNEETNGLLEDKQQQVKELKEIIANLHNTIKTLKQEEKSKKVEKESLEKRVNKNSASIYGSSGRIY